MNETQTFRYRDCYVTWSDSRITLGNGGIEICISIADNKLRTQYIRDKITDFDWQAQDGRGMILPTWTVDPAAASATV